MTVAQTPVDQTTVDQTPEFSRIVQLAQLGSTPLTKTLTASPAEQVALAERYSVDAISSLTAAITVTLVSPKEVRLEADITAKVIQPCVVTQEPVESDVTFTFTIAYDKEAEEVENGDEEEFEDLDLMAEPPELLVDDKIDVGEAISEQLALEIDPFPRVESAEFNGYTSGSLSDIDATLEKKNPFAVLSQLKMKQDK